MENKKFRSIAEFLQEKELKVTIREGRVITQKTIEKWTPELDLMLLYIMTQRSLGAIRRRLLELYNKNNQKPQNWRTAEKS